MHGKSRQETGIFCRKGSYLQSTRSVAPGALVQAGFPIREDQSVMRMAVMTGCWSAGMVPLSSVGWAASQTASTTSMPSVT